MRITIRARKQPTICPSALSRNWLNWNCIGLSSTRMLMVLASAPSDPRRLFLHFDPDKERHRRQADAKQQHALLRRRHDHQEVQGCPTVTPPGCHRGSLSPPFTGFGRRIASAVTTAIITIAPLPEVQPVHSQNSVPRIQETEVRQKFTIA